MKSKNVLILTYYWPPAGGPGVQRWLKFVKYMKDLGWNASILTVRDGTYPAMDKELAAEVPGGIAVYKTRSRDPFRFYNMLKGKKDRSVSVALINIDKKRSLVDRLAMYIRSNFFIPDARKGWVPFAYREALKIIEEEQADLLVTTGPPHSTHLTGLRLKENTGIRWLADFRDPWTNVYYNDMLPRTARTRRIDRNYENAVLGKADALTVVSPGMKDEFSDRNTNIHVVMNGFDLADMYGKVMGSGPESDGLFRLTYTGNFKPNQHVPALWEGICELLGDDAGFAKDFSLRFVGNVDSSVPEYFASQGISSNLEIVDYVPHAEVTRIMSSSSLLLFVIPQARNNELIITGKLFEYLASGRPVIPVGPPGGDAAAILRETSRDEMISYSDKTGFKELLMRYYKEWKNSGGELPSLDSSMLEKYTRKSSAEKMAGIMHDLTP
jgi:glycosyltransferase involved in cell wall biosynthesis